MIHKFINLSTTSFHVIQGLPLCLASSTSKITHFSPILRHPFLKLVHTIAFYFFGPLLLCLIFLTAAFIQFMQGSLIVLLVVVLSFGNQLGLPKAVYRRGGTAHNILVWCQKCPTKVCSEIALRRRNEKVIERCVRTGCLGADVTTGRKWFKEIQ